MSATAVKAMMVIQIIISVFLKGALDDLFGLYFTLQIMCYMKVYDTFFPQSAETFLKEFTKIIEFDVISPEGFIQMFNKDFDLRAYITGNPVAINADQEASVVKDMQVYILIGITSIVFLIIAISLTLLLKSKYSKKIKEKLVQTKDKAIWNGVIRTVYISFAQILMTSAIQFKMVMRDSRYTDKLTYAVCWAATLYSIGVIAMMVYTLKKYKN